MIHSSVPMPSAGSAHAAGKTHGTSANAAEAGSFLAILGNAGNADGAGEASAPSLEGTLASIMFPVAAGNSGKATGKILPDAAGKVAADPDIDADEPSSEGLEDQAGASLAFAVMLPLPAPAHAAAQHVTTGTAKTSPPEVPSGITRKALDGQPLLARSLAELKAGHEVAVAALHVQVAKPITITAGKQNTPAATATVPAELPISTAKTPGTPGAPAALAAQLATSGDAAKGPQAPSATPAVPAVKLAPIEILPQDAAPEVAAATTETMKTVSTTAAQLATRTQQPLSKQDGQIQPAATPANKSRAPGQAEAPASALVGSDARSEAAQPTATAPLPLVAQPSQPHAAPVANVASAAAPQPVEGPQDFSTLVSRLNEAREAANPQVVRTALSHAEFGQISLQFKHEHNALSVTMANSDPAFTGAVHAAVQASQAASNQSQGDNSSQQQQQQNQGSSANQHAAANGAGAGMGQGSGQNQQARADQAGQSMNRGQASAAFPNDQEASAPQQSRDTTRRSGGGIFA
ncbi:hypothetical protein [Novosphingobium malaysiense]|uniref:Uncharacterized protein n=1 Tax=Novosphingobium malaysiense TaxID=1348853 RepID=A0A0B1ZWD4_9SPHN|nr:hypothetical protein [Novosphingobium malaysiense]KHK93493.1 hypothetical protein LK12_04340 [Novosphingobium malaysiense]